MEALSSWWSRHIRFRHVLSMVYIPVYILAILAIAPYAISVHDAIFDWIRLLTRYASLPLLVSLGIVEGALIVAVIHGMLKGSSKIGPSIDDWWDYYREN